jgi:hypothetical protein
MSPALVDPLINVFYGETCICRRVTPHRSPMRVILDFSIIQCAVQGIFKKGSHAKCMPGTLAIRRVSDIDKCDLSNANGRRAGMGPDSESVKLSNLNHANGITFWAQSDTLKKVGRAK